MRLRRKPRQLELPLPSKSVEQCRARLRELRKEIAQSLARKGIRFVNLNQE